MHDSLLLSPHLLMVAARALFVSALILSALSVTYIFYVLILGRVRAYRSPLRNLPGPEEAHWLSGDFVDVHERDSSRLQVEWVRTYGHVIKYHSRFGVRSYSFHLIRGGDLVQRLTILPLADA